MCCRNEDDMESTAHFLSPDSYDLFDIEVAILLHIEHCDSGGKT